MNEKNKPVKKFNSGAISATVWKNESVKDGEPTAFNTISIERKYKDKNDEWQTTTSLRLHDLPRVALVSNKAYEFLALQES